MAGPWYLRSSDGDNADDGLSWANACATMAGILAKAIAAGDIIYVDDDHQETTAADTTWTFPGTEGNPNKVIVVTTDTTAAIATYNCTNQYFDGNDLYHFCIQGEVYFWGVCLQHGDNSINFVDNSKTVIFENSIVKQTGSAVDHIKVGSSDGSRLILINSDIEFSSSAASRMRIEGPCSLVWRGGIFTGDLNDVFIMAYDGPHLEVIGVDLSSVIGGNLIKIDEGTDDGVTVYLKGIKLNATPPTLITADISPSGAAEIIMDIADNGNTVYKFRREYQYGYAQDETTKVITGKALYDGTNEFTVKMTSRATPTCSFFDPWRYHLTTLRETGFAANRTYTVHFAQDHADTPPTALDNDEIWIEVVYPDDSTAQFNITNDKIATPTTTPAAQTTSTESWEGLLTETTLQEIAATINSADGKNGPVEIWVCMAKADTTIYVCPEVYVS